jgi:hypothetical protein
MNQIPAIRKANGKQNFFAPLLRHASPVLIALTLSAIPVNCSRSNHPATKPLLSYSAALKVGMFAYPKNSQTHDQRLVDELACYDQAQTQSGFNPETPPLAGPSDVDLEAAQQARAAWDRQQAAFKRGFAACLDARGYAVR